MKGYKYSLRQGKSMPQEEYTESRWMKAVRESTTEDLEQKVAHLQTLITARENGEKPEGWGSKLPLKSLKFQRDTYQDLIDERNDS